MEIMGVEGQQAGVTVGKKRKLSTKLKGLINELDKIGDPLPEREDVLEAIKILESSGAEGYAYGGLVDEPGQFTDSIFTGEEEDIDIKDIQMQPGFESIEDLDIFEEAKKQGYEEVQTANLMLPFLKLFGKAPDNLVSPIPTPKSELKNPTRKQKESLELQKKKSTAEKIKAKREGIDEINLEMKKTRANRMRQYINARMRAKKPHNTGDPKKKGWKGYDVRKSSRDRNA